MVSRAMILPPIAAWIGILNRCRGIRSLSRSQAAGLGGDAVDDRQRVDRLAVDQDVHLDEVALAVADLVIVEAGIAAADRLQPVVEVEHHLIEGQLVGELGAAGDVGEVLLDAAAVLAELEDRAEIFVGDVDGRLDPGFVDEFDQVGIRPVGGVVDLAQAPPVVRT